MSSMNKCPWTVRSGGSWSPIVARSPVASSARSKRLGIESVLAVSAADRNTLGARLADRAVCIGPARATDSYLRSAPLIEAGSRRRCPGHPSGLRIPLRTRRVRRGVRGERGDLHRARPPRKSSAWATSWRRVAAPRKPVCRSRLVARSTACRQRWTLAETIGYPVLIKAVGGGGGRGLKRANTPDELERPVRPRQLRGPRRVRRWPGLRGVFRHARAPRRSADPRRRRKRDSPR